MQEIFIHVKDFVHVRSFIRKFIHIKNSLI